MSRDKIGPVLTIFVGMLLFAGGVQVDVSTDGLDGLAVGLMGVGSLCLFGGYALLVER